MADVRVEIAQAKVYMRIPLDLAVLSRLISIVVGMLFVFLTHASAAEPSAPTESPAEIVDLTPEPPLAEPRGGAGAEVVEIEADSPEGTPRAIITTNGEMRLGCWLKLDSRSSVNPGKDQVEYEWKQCAGPKLSIGEDQIHSDKLWLYFEQPGEYRLSLRIKNSVGFGPRVEVRIKIQAEEQLIPQQDGRCKVGAGERVLLPGEGWIQVAGPKIELRAENAGMFFRPILTGLYIFQAPRDRDIPERRGVLVPPGRDKIFGDRRPQVEFLNREPVGVVGKALILDASLSQDVDGVEETRLLKARWTTPDKNRGVELVPLEGLKAKLTASQPGTYSVCLVLSDGRLDSDPPENIFVRIDKPARENTDEQHAGWLTDRLQDVLDETHNDPRYKLIKMSLWESNLDQAVQLFPTRCGASLIVDPEFIVPEKLKEVSLNLEVQSGPLLHILDWMARQSEACYRREKNHSFWLTRPLGFYKDEKSEAFVEKVDELYKNPNATDLLEMLNPSFQQIVKAKPDLYTFEFSKEQQLLQGVLPASAKNRLKDIFMALRAPAGQGLPPPQRASDAEIRLRELLASKLVSINTEGRRIRVDYLLRQLSENTGVAIGFEARQFEHGLPRINVCIQNAPLRDAVRTLVEAAGFDGCNVEAPAGLWFYRGPRPYPSSELLWDHSYVAAYDMSRLLQDAAPLSGEVIVHAIKSRVYPESWKDPGALIFYHPSTQKLIVMHGELGQQAILEFLDDLQERTEWALGPVEVEPEVSPVTPAEQE